MKQELINSVLSQMIPYLNNDQAARLQETLEHVLFHLTITQEGAPSENSALPLDAFLAAKKVEGCSEKTLAYYRKTVQDMLDGILIPIIQRDYAQGRRDPGVERIRARFLDSLYEAVTNKPITLDFVYGDIDKEGTMTPLDGQQRLTTLFLLHWYAAKRAELPEDQYAFLRGFGYETRYSARYFCEQLISFSPNFIMLISDEIIDQPWFPLDWQNDPTINAMLVMLDAIHDQFKDIDNLWERLVNGAITFYFLPIRDMGLTDELYIKMNSRGKPLTRFEHFKAELERCLRLVDGATAQRVISKIDREWTDLLWPYCHTDGNLSQELTVDDAFLRFFRYICDVFCFERGLSPQTMSGDIFDLLKLYFVGDVESVLKNTAALESYFDCMCSISPADFFADYISDHHEAGKIVMDTGRYRIDMFSSCIRLYPNARYFPLNRFVLFYAFLTYLLHKGEVADNDFRRRIRIVNNLIQNSTFEISDRSDRNRMPSILQQTKNIILTGESDDTIENNFNVKQLEEEKEKRLYLQEHPEKAETLFMLEDHPRLQGQISIVGIDHVDYAERFVSLFSCQFDLIDCAMMSIDNYAQQERNGWRYQFGSAGMEFAWNELLHWSSNSGFEHTRDVLVQLLSKTETFTDVYLEGVIADFIKDCESASRFPWRYYYVKYTSFRPGSYGRYSNNYPNPEPYMFYVLQTRYQWSENTYMPFLKEADKGHLPKEHYGQRLVYGDRHIICQNSSYALRDNATEEVIETIPIQQDEQGIDTEDRVIKLKKYISEMPASMNE